jgi:DoxX-like family
MATLPTDAGMHSITGPGRAVWAGRVLSGLAILALTIDAAGKLAVPELMIANSPPLGLPADPAFHRQLGAILAFCTALYAWPRTSVLGAILLTGYLGGAVSAHLRVGSPLASFTLVGVYIGVVVWLGLWLRDPRVRTLFA